jgi:2-oxoglutarate ferredoxin oxidoreductase subunit alpha
MNTGQYVREVRRILGNKKVDFFGQMNGKLITPGQIKEVIAHG